MMFKRFRPVSWVALITVFVTHSAVASAPSEAPRQTVAIVLGAEGAPEYGRDFAAAADRFAEAAKSASARVVQIGRDAESTNTDRQQLQSLLEAEAKNDSDPLWLIFIGHGTFDGKEAKFNLRGPDVSDVELAAWLKPVRRPLALINCASASAPFLNRCSGLGRVVVTATRSGSEIQLTRLAEHLSASIADPAADLDKDGQTSLLEAFLAAAHNVDAFYKEAGRLATEHALLDDNGDARGTPAAFFQGLRATRAARDGAPLDGPRAHQWHLVLSRAEQAMPADARAKRDQLELQLEALRAKKSALTDDDYYRQLDALLLQLAPLYQTPTPPSAP